MDTDYVSVGKRVRECRKKAGLSQEKLAELVDCSNEHISHIEKAHTKLSLKLLVQIANALGVTADALLCDSLDHAYKVYECEVQEYLNICTIEERRIVTEIVKTTVQALHKNSEK